MAKVKREEPTSIEVLVTNILDLIEGLDLSPIDNFEIVLHKCIRSPELPIDIVGLNLLEEQALVKTIEKYLESLSIDKYTIINKLIAIPQTIDMDDLYV